MIALDNGDMRATVNPFRPKLLAELFAGLLSRWYCVDYVIRLRRTGQILVENMRTQTRVIRSNHGIPQHRPLQQSLPTVVQILHK